MVDLLLEGEILKVFSSLSNIIFKSLKKSCLAIQNDNVEYREERVQDLLNSHNKVSWKQIVSSTIYHFPLAKKDQSIPCHNNSWRGGQHIYHSEIGRLRNNMLQHGRESNWDLKNVFFYSKSNFWKIWWQTKQHFSIHAFRAQPILNHFYPIMPINAHT